MKSHWFSIATVFAALLIGYNLIARRDTEIDMAPGQSTVLGYYLKDAVVVETNAAGAPHMRFAASELHQTDDDRVTLTQVRVDYLTPKKERGQTSSATASRHWVVNADSALMPANLRRPPPRGDNRLSTDQRDSQIKLRGNVTAQSTSADHSAMLSAPTLDIDAELEVATTDDDAIINIDGHTAHGRGLYADLNQNLVKLQSNVTLQMAATPAQAQTPAPRPGRNPTLSLPELFEMDALDYQDNILVLTNVRSRTPPFVSANQGRATGVDLTNNQVVLSGAVRLELPQQGWITADVATITVRNQRVVRAQVTGAPVNFQHRYKETEPPVQGRANAIDYDVLGQTVQFSGDAWFNNGKFEFASELIEYNLVTGAAHSTRGSGGTSSAKIDPVVIDPVAP